MRRDRLTVKASRTMNGADSFIPGAVKKTLQSAKIWLWLFFLHQSSIQSGVCPNLSHLPVFESGFCAHVGLHDHITMHYKNHSSLTLGLSE